MQYYREGDYEEEILFLKDHENPEDNISPQMLKVAVNFIKERLPLGQLAKAKLEDDCIYAFSEDGSCLCALDKKHKDLVELACNIVNNDHECT